MNTLSTAKEQQLDRHTKLVTALAELNLLIDTVREEQDEFRREVRERDLDLRSFIQAELAGLKADMVKGDAEA